MRSLLAALLLAACSASPALSPRDCTPGATSACACPGASGVQTCNADGTLGSCVCADAGATPDRPDAPAPEDRPTPMDRVELPDVVLERDAGVEDRPDVQPDRAAADAPVCQLQGMGELPRRRCATSGDCRGCAELVPGYEWCCGLAGYCENRPPGQCTGDAGIYTPDAGPVNCGALDWNPRCRTHQDCQAACLPTGVNRVPWCCNGGGCVVSTGGMCR